MAFSHMVINWSAADGINLIQLAAFVTGDSKNAGATAAKVIDTLSVKKKRTKINGSGKEVWVGSYNDAVRIAKHLRASEEQLVCIKEHFQDLTRTNEVPEEETLDVTLFPSRESVESLVKSEVTFPVILDKEVSAWLGFSKHYDARKQVRKLEAEDEIRRGLDFQEVEIGIDQITGRADRQYCFTKHGFKEFAMLCGTTKARHIRKYFLEIEEEYWVLEPEFRKAQAEIERLNKENEALRRKSERVAWTHTRADSIEVQKETMDELNAVIGNLDRHKQKPIYAILNDCLDKGVLGFEETTAQFKKNRNIPDRVSIPALLDKDGLDERMRISKLFLRFFKLRFEKLQQMPAEEIVATIKGMAKDAGRVNLLVGDLKDNLLTVEEAKKRQLDRDRELKAKRICCAGP